MSGYLLDTNVAIFALAASDHLSAPIRRVILKGPNVISVASYWEVMLKSMKGKLDVGDPRIWWEEALDKLTATPLAVRPEHIAGVYALPPLHKDPFDRVLIAQAVAEELVFVTRDVAVTKYASPGLKIVR